MKQKTAMVSLLLLASTLTLLVGCNRSKSATEPQPLEGRQAKLTFTLQMPQGEPVTYRSAIHDEAEWTVRSLTMYQFNADGSKLISKDEIDMSKLHKTADAEYSYTKEFAESEVGTTCRFLFVANDNIADVTVGTTTRAELEQKLMTKQLQADGTSKDILTGADPNYTIPMSGVAKQGGSELIALTGTNKGTMVTLTRTVARIDVANHVPNLTITKISLRNTYDRTTTFPTMEAGQPTYKAPTGAQKVTMSAGFASLPNPFQGIAGKDGNELKKAFYLYEGEQPTDETQKDQALTVIVEGHLANGLAVTYELPFSRSHLTYSPIDIKRNYIYKLILGDNSPLEPGSKLTFSIEDTPWNAVLLNHHMPILDVELVRTFESKKCKYDYLNHTLYTNSLDLYDFQLTNRFKDHTKYTIKPLDSNAETIPHELVKDVLDMERLFKVDLETAAKTKPFDKVTIQYEITSNAAPEIKRILTIVYDKDYVNSDFKK